MESCDYVNLPMDDLENVHIGKPISSLDISVPTPEKKKKRRSRCTCLNVCLCVTLFLFGFVVFSMLVAYMCVAGLVQKYTVEDRPGFELETVRVPEVELERFKDRVEAFADGLDSEGVSPPEHLVIEESELNGLFADSDVLNGHMKATLEEDQMSLDISMPTGLLPGGKERRFVASQLLKWRKGSLTLTATIFSEKTVHDAFKGLTFYNPDHAFSCEFSYRLGRSNDHKLVVDFENGFISPDLIMTEKQEDMLAELYESDDEGTKQFVHALNVIEKISLEDGQIIVYTRDGERRSLTAMDASSYLFGGMSSVARRLVGF